MTYLDSDTLRALKAEKRAARQAFHDLVHKDTSTLRPGPAWSEYVETLQRAASDYMMRDEQHTQYLEAGLCPPDTDV